MTTITIFFREYDSNDDNAMDVSYGSGNNDEAAHGQFDNNKIANVVRILRNQITVFGPIFYCIWLRPVTSFHLKRKKGQQSAYYAIYAKQKHY